MWTKHGILCGAGIERRVYVETELSSNLFREGDVHTNNIENFYWESL